MENTNPNLIKVNQSTFESFVEKFKSNLARNANNGLLRHLDTSFTPRATSDGKIFQICSEWQAR